MAKNGCLNMILILAVVFVGLYFLQTMSAPKKVLYREGMENYHSDEGMKKMDHSSYDVAPNDALAAKLNMPGCTAESDCSYKPKPDIIPADMHPSAMPPTCPRPIKGQCDSGSHEAGDVPRASCFPRSQLNPEELLPKDECNQWSKANPHGAGALADKNFLQAGWATGISTVGSVMRNANLQLRSEPPNPQQRVSPWLQTTISPDLGRKPLELGGCA